MKPQYQDTCFWRTIICAHTSRWFSMHTQSFLKFRLLRTHSANSPKIVKCRNFYYSKTAIEIQRDWTWPGSRRECLRLLTTWSGRRTVARLLQRGSYARVGFPPHQLGGLGSAVIFPAGFGAEQQGGLS